MLKVPTLVIAIALPFGSPSISHADIDSDLHVAAMTGDQAKVQELLKRGANIDSRGTGGGNAPAGTTPLMMAAVWNRLQIVRTLISAGAKVNISDEGGGTALIYAVWKGHVEVIRELLQHGADPNARTRDGRTPLMVAQKADHRRRRRVFEDRQDLALQGRESLHGGVEIVVGHQIRHATGGHAEI